MCNIQSNSFKLDITSIYESILNTTLKVNDTIVIINGSHFNDYQEFINNTYFKCNGYNDKFNCSFIDYTSLSCNLTMDGPFNIDCTLIFNQTDNTLQTFTYSSPLILNVTNTIDPTIGGIITIIGNEFYKQIQSVSIDNIKCNEFTFFSSNEIHCFMDSISDYNVSTLSSTSPQSINVTINGKSDLKEFPILIIEKTITNENHYELISIIVVVPFIVLTIYIIHRYYRSNKEKSEDAEMNRNVDAMCEREDQRIRNEKSKLSQKQSIKNDQTSSITSKTTEV